MPMNLSQTRIIILIILSTIIFPFQVHSKMPSLTHPHPNPPLEGEARILSSREKAASGSISVYDRALKMYRKGEFKEAIKLLRQKQTIDAGDANLLGWAYLKTGDAEEAIRQFRRSVSLAPSSYDSYCGLGFSYMRTGRLREAHDSFDKGTSGNSKDIDCLLGKAGVLERLDEKEKAADVYRKVLAIDRDNDTAKEKVAVSTREKITNANEDIEFFAKGDYFWMRLKDEVKPFFIKGVNLGFGLPGKYPTEFPEDINTYLEWFRMIKEIQCGEKG